jgi:rhodanese-related sulfurtransferase
VTRRRWLLTAVALVAAVHRAAGAQEADDAGRSPLRIEWDEFKRQYDAGAIIVIDVRDADAFRAGHIPGARSVPSEEVERAARDLAALGKPVVTYCACPSEHTSAEAAETLRRSGIDARALVGGWNKWYDATGGRVERGAGPRR